MLVKLAYDALASLGTKEHVFIIKHNLGGKFKCMLFSGISASLYGGIHSISTKNHHQIWIHHLSPSN